MDARRRNLLCVSFSQFGTAFSSHFIQVFFAFYIFDISPYSRGVTLLWIGAIIGSTGICSALTATFWGSLTHRFSPKLLYMRALLVNFISFFLMGFAADVRALLILRIFLGIATGTSTVGMIIVSSTSPKEKIAEDIGFFQAWMTCGQLLGPLVGSIAAAALGYKWAFIAASSVVFTSAVFCYFYVENVPTLPRKEKAGSLKGLDRRIFIGWLLCFSAIVQLTYLPSVLPNVFEEFSISRNEALKLAGPVVMLYTATAMIGTYLWTKAARRIGVKRLIICLSILGILFQSLFVFSRGVMGFTVFRMCQTGVVAATFSLVISVFAGTSGTAIGFLNSARMAATAAGPLIATSVVAASNLSALYLLISGMTLVFLMIFTFFFKTPRSLGSTSPR